MNFKYLPKFCRTSCDTNTDAIRPKARKEGYRTLGSSDAPATSSNVNSHLGTMAPSSSRVPKPVEGRMDLASQNHGDSSQDVVTEVVDLEERKAVIGVLDVYIHRAKDIKEICIYQKQDVYATISLTDDPETAVATKTVNGGGNSPIFNEKLQLNVQSVESTLRCEIWMFSRIRNYLHDQSLGFIMVPVSQVINHNGKLQRRFALSSNEVFHSPCGYLYLTITYTGTVPELVHIAPAHPSSVVSTERRRSLRDVMERIEIPDPYLGEENERMVAEYYAQLEANIAADAVAPAAEPDDVAEAPPMVQTPPRSMIVDGSSSVTVATNTPLTAHTSGASASVDQNLDKAKDVGEASGSANHDVGESSGSGNQLDVVLPGERLTNVAEVANPLGSLNIVLDQNLVQGQDFAELYMQSIKECNDALENLILPVDLTAQPVNPDEDKGQSSRDGASSSRVYYGSRAFF